MAPIHRFSAEEMGKAPREGPDLLPPKKLPVPCRRDEVARLQMTRPWCERPPPRFLLPLYAQAEGPGERDRRVSPPMPQTWSTSRKDARHCSWIPRRGLLSRAHAAHGDASKHLDPLPFILSHRDATEGASRALAVARRLRRSGDWSGGRSHRPGQGLHELRLARGCRDLPNGGRPHDPF